jgi:hypothetical protein
MSRTAGYFIAAVIVMVSVHPTVTLQAKLRDQEPDSKQAPKKPQDKLVINTKLVNLTVSVNDKLGRFVAGLSKEDFEIIS